MVGTVETQKTPIKLYKSLNKPDNNLFFLLLI